VASIQRLAVFTTPASLPDDPATLKAVLSAALAEIERLHQLIAGLQRHRFGRRSEKLDDAIVEQGAEDLGQALAEQQAGLEAAAAGLEPPAPAPRPPPPRPPPRRNRGALPAALPRVELIVDIEDKACPCCRNPLHPIGEDVAEMLDYIPAQLRVKVIRRPRYGCRSCEGAVVQAPAPERPIDGGLATEALLAHVLAPGRGAASLRTSHSPRRPARPLQSTASAVRPGPAPSGPARGHPVRSAANH